MKKITIFFIIILLLNVACSQLKPLSEKKHSVNTELENIIDYSPFKTAGFGFYAIDLNSGEVISQYQADMALRPASTQKLITTAAALNLLGPGFTFKTQLAYSGEIIKDSNYLDGDLYIIGGGDPALGSKYFDETQGKQFLGEFYAEIENLGIDSVAGRVIADARYYGWDLVPPGWSWQNMGQYYGAGPSGITVYDNYFSILFNTQNYGDTTQIVGTEPQIPELFFNNSVTADSISYDNAYVFGAPYSNRRIVNGELPLNRSNFKVKASMPDPAFVAALQLDSTLRAGQIKISKNPKTVRMLVENGDGFSETNCKVFFEKLSPPLSQIVSQTNVHSINLFAEHCLMQIGKEMGAANQTVASADSLMAWWQKVGMDIEGMSINDGSGLSQYNVITPRQMVFMLSYMKNESKYYKEFYNSLAIAGETGTIKKMFKGSSAEGNLRAKSGTITRAKAYAGYVTSASGREIAFSMVVNNFSCRSSETRAKLEELMIALSNLNK